MNRNWKTEYKPLSETIQARREYVVHGRGFTIGDDVWFDEYSLHLEHHRYWNDVVRHYYDYPKWPAEQNWTYYCETEIDEVCAYWSINGNAMFILQYPKVVALDEEEFTAAMETLEDLDPNPTTYVRFERSTSVSLREGETPDRSSHAASLVEPGLPKKVIEYKDIDGIESIK